MLLGGLSAVVYTEVLQTAIMIVGASILMIIGKLFLLITYTV